MRVPERGLGAGKVSKATGEAVSSTCRVWKENGRKKTEAIATAGRRGKTDQAIK